MSWLDPRTWFSSTPAATSTPLGPGPVGPMDQPPAPAYGGRRRKTRRGRRHSKKSRSGRKSTRS